MIPFLAHYLYLLAAWTLLIKFAFPVVWALAHVQPPLSHVLWDLWWVVHIALGWSLLHWRPYTWPLAVGVSVAEIVIVTTKFVLFLSAPEWTIWRTNWFINKVFVLACFVLLLWVLMARRDELRAMGARPVPEAAT